MEFQLEDRNRNLVDNFHTERYFQGDCEERLGDGYVVQIFHNFFGRFDVSAYSFLFESDKKQVNNDWLRNNVHDICGKYISDVELRYT